MFKAIINTKGSSAQFALEGGICACPQNVGHVVIVARVIAPRSIFGCVVFIFNKITIPVLVIIFAEQLEPVVVSLPIYLCLKIDRAILVFKTQAGKIIPDLFKLVRINSSIKAVGPKGFVQITPLPIEPAKMGIPPSVIKEVMVFKIGVSYIPIGRCRRCRQKMAGAF